MANRKQMGFDSAVVTSSVHSPVSTLHSIRLDLRQVHYVWILTAVGFLWNVRKLYIFKPLSNQKKHVSICPDTYVAATLDYFDKMAAVQNGFRQYLSF